MFDHIRKLLKELHPFGISCLKLALAFQLFKGFMITMYHKLLGKKVELPTLQGSNKSIKFLIIGGVVELKLKKSKTLEELAPPDRELC